MKCGVVRSQIASLLDADDLRIEGIMPGGSKSTFTLPVTSEACTNSSLQLQQQRNAGTALHCCCKLLVLGIQFIAMILHAGTAAAALRSSSCHADPNTSPAPPLPAFLLLCIAVYCFGSNADVGATLRRKLLMPGIPFTAMSLQEAAAQAAGHGSGGGRGGSSSSSGGSRGSGGGAAAGPQLYLAPAQLENSLNRLFEGTVLLFVFSGMLFVVEACFCPGALTAMSCLGPDCVSGPCGKQQASRSSARTPFVS
jgi:hypothetical protein